MNAGVARVAPKPRATAGVLASSTSPSAPVIAPRRVVIIFVILPLRSRALKPAAGEARALQSGDDRRVASHIFPYKISAMVGDHRQNRALIDAEIIGIEPRSEERRVGKECVSTCRSRWSPYH